MGLASKKIGIILSAAGWLLFSACAFSTAQVEQARGLWVESEGVRQTLSSRVRIDEMIERARSCGFNCLFVQVYRHDRAWFNSSIADRSPYLEFVKREKVDLLEYVIRRAHAADLEVHAWVNVFRIGLDRGAPVLKKLGKEAVTRDGKNVSLLEYAPAQLPDGGYWLDPGDRGVQAYLLQVVSELVERYPGLDGIHLDFIRYPYSFPYAGSFWANRNDLGYGSASVNRFREWTGLNPLDMELTRENCQAWDDWRRYQVNNFVYAVARTVLALNPKTKVSAAGMAWADRAYQTSFQDWRRWLEEGAVDFVATMNYTLDRRLAGYLTRTALAAQGRRQVYIGLGAYLLVDRPEVLIGQMEDCVEAGAPGVIIFSYDSIAPETGILERIKAEPFRRPARLPSMPWRRLGKER